MSDAAGDNPGDPSTEPAPKKCTISFSSSTGKDIKDIDIPLTCELTKPIAIGIVAFLVLLVIMK